MGTLMSRVQRALALAAVAALGLMVVSCGDDDDASQDTTTTSEATTTAPADEPAVEPEVVELGAEVYYAGFRVDVVEARLGATDVGDDLVVEIDLMTENLRESDAIFPADELELRWDDEAATTMSLGDLVRPGASGRLTVEFMVDESFAFDDAALYAGTERQIQAMVPLSDPDATIAAAPIALEAPELTVDDGQIEAAITGLELFAFDPLSRISTVDQQPVDSPILLVTVDVTMLVDSRYDANVMGDSFRLVLPDGTQISPEGGPNEIISGGETLRGVMVAFELDGVVFDADELGGDVYVLNISPTGPGLDDALVELEFELTPAG